MLYLDFTDKETDKLDSDHSKVEACLNRQDLTYYDAVRFGTVYNSVICLLLNVIIWKNSSGEILGNDIIDFCEEEDYNIEVRNLAINLLTYFTLKAYRG